MFKFNSTNLTVQFYTEMNWFMVRKSPQFFTEGFFGLKMKMKKLFLLVILSNFLFSQKDSIQIVKLDEIEIKSIKTSSILESVPLSITKTSVPRLWSKQQLSFQEYINSIPGVLTFNANNFAQDLRISIRGFGARSAFGIRGIKIIIDGIPETTPDGQGWVQEPTRIVKSIQQQSPDVIRCGCCLFCHQSFFILRRNTIRWLFQASSRRSVQREQHQKT